MNILLEKDPKQEDIAFIRRGLSRFNEQTIRPENFERIFIGVRTDEGNIIGGLIGSIYWEVLYIEVLFVDDAFRNKGIASELLVEVENYAIEKNCYMIIVDTFDFQAPKLYQKHGYQKVGQVDNYPKGHTMFYLKKEL